MQFAFTEVLLFGCLVWGVRSIPLLYQDEWDGWRLQHSKVYETFAEERYRYEVWLDNKLYVERHNIDADKHGYSLKMNSFGDRTFLEWWNITTCHAVSGLNYTSSVPKFTYVPAKSDKVLPSTVNWINENAVTDVKNQEDYLCHSCYAFAATGALEGALAILTGKLVPLSEQQIIDCSRVFANTGCHGGTYRNAWNYISAVGGIESQESYPYHAYTNLCTFKEGLAVTTVKMAVSIQSGSESDLAFAVAERGPVAVAIDHRHRSFQFYAYGIYAPESCSNQYKDLSHEMVVVGYGTNSGKDYWWLKNSYGPNWGMNGYMMIARNKGNVCGVATEAGFPAL